MAFPHDPENTAAMRYWRVTERKVDLARVREQQLLIKEANYLRASPAINDVFELTVGVGCPVDD